LPGPEDPLSRELDRLTAPVDPAGAYERIVEKRIRRQFYRRVEMAILAVVVLTGTVGGTVVLTRAFRPDAVAHQALGTAEKRLTGNGEIAFVSSVESGGRIFAIAPDGSRLKALTTHAAHGAAWSPDGSKIAFSSSVGGSVFDIFVMSADGTGLTNLTNSPTVIDEDPAWSPDGRQLAFVSNRKLSYEVWVMNADGSRARQLTGILGQGVRHPTWSPDGKRIAFSARESASLSRGAIYTINSDGSGLNQIREESGCCVYDVLGPDSWSPDGSRIVFTRDHGQTGRDLYSVKADGSSLVRLARGVASGSASWSPDGHRIVFSRQDGVYVMDADGEHQAKVPDVPAGASSPVWRPSRTSLPGPPSPTQPPPSPLHTPPSPPSLGQECNASTVYGDFDGDGLVDTATVAKTSCLYPDDPGYPFDTLFAMEVRWGGAAGGVPLPDCEEECRALAAVDFNGDGAAELVLQIGSGASTDRVEVYELPAEERFGQHPAIIAEPGSAEYPGGESAVFALGGSVTHLDFLTCITSEDGTLQIQATSYDLNKSQTEYAVGLTVFVFDVQNLDGEFVVQSSSDSTFPFDPTGESQPQPRGTPCWTEGGSIQPTSVP
jgi:TolB protein